MRPALHLGLQLLAAYAVGVFYFVLDVAVQDVGASVFGFVVGFLATFHCVLVMLVAGLPLRIFRPLRDGLRRWWWMPLILLAVAFLLLFAHRFSGFGADFLCGARLLGWLMAIFAALHFQYVRRASPDVASAPRPPLPLPIRLAEIVGYTIASAAISYLLTFIVIFFPLTQKTQAFDEESHNGTTVSFGPEPAYLLIPSDYDGGYSGHEWGLQFYRPLCMLWIKAHGYEPGAAWRAKEKPAAP